MLILFTLITISSFNSEGLAMIYTYNKSMNTERDEASILQIQDPMGYRKWTMIWIHHMYGPNILTWKIELFYKFFYIDII